MLGRALKIIVIANIVIFSIVCVNPGLNTYHPYSMTFNLSFKFFPHDINGTIMIGQWHLGTQSCHQRDQNGSLSGIFFPGRRSESR